MDHKHTRTESVHRAGSKVGRSSGNGRDVCFGTPKSGQAMAEFLVGLVGIMLLIVGLQQVSIISRKSFEAHVNVRTQLAEQMVDPMADYTGDYIFVATVDKGEDQKGYTGDDRILEGDDGFFTEGNGFLDLVNYYDVSGYLLDPTYDREDPYHRLEDSSFLVLSESFSMYYAADNQAVDVVPFLRTVIGRDTINLKREAWIPSWGNLMEIVP